MLLASFTPIKGVKWELIFLSAHFSSSFPASYFLVVECAISQSSYYNLVPDRGCKISSTNVYSLSLLIWKVLYAICSVNMLVISWALFYMCHDMQRSDVQLPPNVNFVCVHIYCCVLLTILTYLRRYVIGLINKQLCDNNPVNPIY